MVNRDELDVTVKVINSTEDNRPGKVLISNRQPEGASLLTATLVDADQPIENLRWQWYRSDPWERVVGVRANPRYLRR